MLLFRLPFISGLLTFLVVGIAAYLYAGGAAVVNRLDEMRSFNIPAGSLESALMQLGRETKVQLIVGPKVGDRTVVAVRGRFTGRQVLEVLLPASGLGYKVVGNTVTIEAQHAQVLSCTGLCSRPK